MSKSEFGISHLSYWTQLVALVLVTLAGLSIGGIIVTAILGAVGIDGSDMTTITDSNINVYRVMQIFMHTCMFMLPALAFSYLKNRDFSYLKLTSDFHPTPVSYVVFAGIAALPVLGALLQLNQEMVLPEFLHGIEEWMRSSEDSIKEMTEKFLVMNNVGEFALTMLMVGVMPAIAEEFLFRGCLQRLFREWTKRPHLSIWLSAAIFSFIHFQFYGFVPRMLMGAFMGYLFYWSGNLWYPILAHFVNNGFQVLVYYLNDLGLFGTDLKDLDVEGVSSTANGSLIGAILLGGLLLSIFTYLYYQFFQNREVLLNTSR